MVEKFPLLTKLEARMYKKVVVPLDGSDLAEATLPHLEEIARGCSIADIMLISVTEMIKGRIEQSKVQEQFTPEKPAARPTPPIGMASTVVVYNIYTNGVQETSLTMGKMARTAAEYLSKIADGLGDKGFNVSAAVILGDPAEQIVRYVNEQKADLIIMASTGKSKMSRWDMSHISAQVIKDTCTPVLLIKPESEFKETKAKRKGVAL
jgi:nucleotide-binding universal stress UspA family protein